MKRSQELPRAVTELLALCEELYLQRCVLQVILDESQPTKWRGKYGRVLKRGDLKEQARSVFSEMAQRIRHAENVRDTIRGLLELLPTPEKPN
jgi:hypothetical protein